MKFSSLFHPTINHCILKTLRELTLLHIPSQEAVLVQGLISPLNSTYPTSPTEEGWSNKLILTIHTLDMLLLITIMLRLEINQLSFMRQILELFNFSLK